MLSKDEDAVICDLAETYRIYDYRALTPSKVAVLCIGLRDDSRIKMELTGQKLTTTDSLLALCLDRLSFLVWAQSKDAQRGQNRPKSVYEALQGLEKNQKENVRTFRSGADFDAVFKQITGGG